MLEKAARLGLLSAEDAEVLRPAVRLYQNLSQILRLCLSGPFDPKKADAGLLRLLARAADVPDFATLDAHRRPKRRRGCASASIALWGRGTDQAAADLPHVLCVSAPRAASAPARWCRRRGSSGCASAAMQFDQRFGDGEAEPRAVMALGELAFDLLERPAKLCSASFGMPMPVSLIAIADAAAATRAAHGDAAAVRRELHRIRQAD